jgi:hypothetical protein
MAFKTLQLVGTDSNESTTGASISADLTSLTGGLGATALEGDIVIVAFSYTSADNTDRDLAPTTTGYTELADLYFNDSFEAQTYVGYKIMGATPDTAVTIPANGDTGEPSTVAVHVWRNVDQTTPIDVTTTTATAGNTSIADPPSITPTTAGSVVLAIGGAASNSAYLSGVPSGYSNGVLTNATSGSALVNSVGIGSKAWTTGAEDPAVFSITGTDNGLGSWNAVTLALRPAELVNEVKSINGLSNV